MQKYIDAINSAIINKNWYGALFIALSLPDICGSIDSPHSSSSKRYTAWFAKYVEPSYTKEIGAEHIKHVFLSSSDCYALRCSYLHSGTGWIANQRIRKVLDNFVFTIPPKTGSTHCNQINNTLQLQVDIFCQDICFGIQKWQQNISTDKNKKKKLNELLNILSKFKLP